MDMCSTLGPACWLSLELSSTLVTFFLGGMKELRVKRLEKEKVIARMVKLTQDVHGKP